MGNHLSDIEISAYVDGEMPQVEPRVMAHVGQCQHCREKLRAEQVFVQRLRRAFVAGPSEACLTEEEMAAYPVPEMNPKEAKKTEEHIRACAYCSLRLAFAELISEPVRPAPSRQKPPQRIMSIFKEHVRKMAEPEKTRGHEAPQVREKEDRERR